MLVYVDGCHVRRLHSASAAMMEFCRASAEKIELVGLAKTLPWLEKEDEVEEASGLIYGAGYELGPRGD